MDNKYEINKAEVSLKIDGKVGKESFHDYSNKTVFDEMKESMKLPEGKICSDCANWSGCDFLFSCIENNTNCDYSPSRFVDIGLSDNDEYNRID